MRTLQYQGTAPGYYAQCGYTFRVIDGTPTLVLKQDPAANIFVDTSIEGIVTGLLGTELADVDATRLRVFRMDSSRIWTEIRFGSVARRKVNLTWRQRLKGLFGGAVAQAFEVTKPSWDAITPEQRVLLESLDPALAPTKMPSEL